MPENRSDHSGHRQRLRARFLKTGLDGMADYEAVELLLTLVLPQGDVKPQAKALIGRFKSLRGILDAPPEELREVPGIGPVTSEAIKIVKAAAILYLKQTAEDTDSLAEPERLFEFWKMQIGALAEEVFEVAYLDSAYRLIKVDRLEEGTIDRATVYPRKVVEAALRRNAYAIVLAHNHPNGTINPSEQDKLLTRAVVLGAETVHLKVHDHLIVTANDCFSFRKAGLL